jgi:hypothetical protein
MKRSRGGDELTGGSKDVNPQTLVMVPAVQPAADTTDTTGTPMPIPRLPIRKGKSLVIEILKVTMTTVTTGYVANTITGMSIILSTNPVQPATAIAAFEDPRTICQWDRTFINVATGNGTSFEVIDKQKVFDLTDEAGHGYLVATDNLYLSMVSAGTGAANTGNCKFSYRFKEVNLEEYIGIVQSQQ